MMGVRLAMNSAASLNFQNISFKETKCGDPHRRPEEQPPKLLASSSTFAVVLPDRLIRRHKIVQEKQQGIQILCFTLTTFLCLL